MVKCWSRIKYNVLVISNPLKQGISRLSAAFQNLRCGDNWRAALNRGFMVLLEVVFPQNFQN